MEFLRLTVARIAQQLDVLNRSQKVAIGLCAVLIAFSLVWLVNYAAAPEMVPLLKQDLTLDQVQAALDTLEADRIDAKQVGSRIYVKPVDRDRALLALNRADALPADTSVGFVELMSDSDPFRPADENQWRRLVALGTELGRIIAASDDVHTARVVIQDKSKRRIGTATPVKPTASVQVKMARGKPLDQYKVDGICRFIAGAVPGLEPHNVTVRDASTGRAFQAPDPEDILGLGLLEEKKKNEKYLADKVREALQAIPGVIVAVTVELDASRTKTQTSDWGKAVAKSEESTSEIQESSQTPGETGVNPNVGVALSANSGGTRSSTEQERTDFFEPKPIKVESIEKVPFDVVRTTASIGIPRSFLVGIHQARFGSDTDPAALEEDENFQLIRKTEIDRVRARVSTILMAQADDDVNVEVFYDFAPESGELNTMQIDGVVMAGAQGGVGGYAKRYGVQGGLVVLAFVSFLTMARLVRKSSDVVKAVLPPERRAVEDEESEETLHVAGGGPVGRASASEGLLVGQEVDEQTLRYSQLGEQVNEMVVADPATAAELVRRWAESDD